MKIKYEFVTGEVTEVEVDEIVGTFIVDSRRVESNQGRKERYHCISSDGMDFEGLDFATFNTPETEYQIKLLNADIQEVIESFTPIQKKRLSMYLDGMTMREIARKEGVQHKAVVDSFERMRKKLKKFYKYTIQTPLQISV